jgi:signal transduction histidine kinase
MGLGFTVDQAEQLPLMYGDPAQVMQIIENLVMFALSQGGTDAVSLSVRHFNNYIKFSITDKGQGLTEEVIDKLFESFELPLNCNEQVIISPFSMALTKLLVERQGGRMTISSNIGQGTISSFTLPVAKS